MYQTLDEEHAIITPAFSEKISVYSRFAIAMALSTLVVMTFVGMSSHNNIMKKTNFKESDDGRVVIVQGSRPSDFVVTAQLPTQSSGSVEGTALSGSNVKAEVGDEGGGHIIFINPGDESGGSEESSPLDTSEKTVLGESAIKESKIEIGEVSLKDGASCTGVTVSGSVPALGDVPMQMEAMVLLWM